MGKPWVHCQAVRPWPGCATARRYGRSVPPISQTRQWVGKIALRAALCASFRRSGEIEGTWTEIGAPEGHVHAKGNFRHETDVTEARAPYRVDRSRDGVALFSTPTARC